MNLQPESGLPILLNENGLLEFQPPLEPVLPSVRKIADMRDFLFDQQASFSDGENVYYMYRGVCLTQDKEKFKKAHLRYDLTVIKPGLLGKEFSRTIGHFHPFKPGTKIRYPEIYEVIFGRALFEIQKMNDDFTKLTEVYLIEANQGEKIIFPPGFGHISINATPQNLVLANWLDESFESDYRPYDKYNGPAYYLMADEAGNLAIKPNKEYLNIPPLIKLKPKDLSSLGLKKSEPMYLTGQNSPNMLQFLYQPELFADQLTIDRCYIVK